ncbi:ribosome biogenesis/translation initiation ATPase RLI [Candidatus Woesearchaeota archaeon]|nr:ribosome biogenesis/translation initiation ATPase RLI [Candidatus Woesearchaeota archaeon]
MRKVIAVVEKSKCHPNKCQHECMKYDPINKSGGEGFHLGLSGKSEISEEVVMEVHKICAKKCPFQAIHIINLPERLKEEPIHKYGKNSFELFSLPIIKPNIIVGIIGRNGIGKSSSLQILTGNIKPNLGFYDKQISESEVIKKYSNTWLAEYFQKLIKKEVKVSYKPQRVELLVQLYNNHKVHDLLNKVDERNIIKNLMSELDISNISERKIEELSGGELQRVAIVAAAAKDADVYYFDEPSSFLDITHRIKAAKLIRKLSEKASVIVVEHDLATLDYISDEIQIVYGEPACYGIFSQSKGVRRGINDYMEGMFPEENIRFRKYPIRFSERPVERFVSKDILFSFPELEKHYEIFKLKTAAGAIHKGEVMAIMGANGLGKSTFLKLISGIETPDKGVMEKLKISYKPQYLEQNIEGTVEEHLKKIAGPEFLSGWYKTNILEKLNIEPILHNQISELSGGELQKIHIAACLSKQNTDIIAMDEPSAFIDVEDRLSTAEIIKDFVINKEIAAIIVDHDIQFIDYLADSMLIFEGIPAKEGHVYGPVQKREGMNHVLKNLDITYRRDKLTGRPRINKPGSQLDQEQRYKGEYYYT